MQCSNCGYESSSGSRFCARCGTTLAPPVAPPAPDPPPWASAPPPATPAAWGQPAASPAPPAPPPAATTPGANPYAPPSYGQYPPYGAAVPYPGAGPTNGLAIASFVLGLVGWIPCGVGSVIAIVLGFVARSNIRTNGRAQGGDGLAIAGIVLGFVGIALWVLVLVTARVNGSSS
jgi:hypothetical protein